MYKNLIKESLKVKFFKDKEVVINEYFNYLTDVGAEDVEIYSYTGGKKVILDKATNTAYTRNGYFFSVILKDDEYLETLNEEELLTFLDGELSTKYELTVDENVDIEGE